jgi:hypothetical protein
MYITILDRFFEQISDDRSVIMLHTECAYFIYRREPRIFAMYELSHPNNIEEIASLVSRHIHAPIY